MTRIKVCGLTCEEDIVIVNTFPIDYAGFVLYFPKSKRNVSLEQAQKLKRGLNEKIQSVAVCVSPTLEQVKAIQGAGFDCIQIHGTLHKEVEALLEIPIFRAVNVTTEDDVRNAMIAASSKIRYFVFDGKSPGSGKTFDWGFLKRNVDNASQIMLAGGLSAENVGEAILFLNPGIVDVSSSVEKSSGIGKDQEKIAQFVSAVATI